MTEIRRVIVVGAGQMGNGIAHVAAAAGLEVQVADSSPDMLARARETIAKNLAREVAKGKRSQADSEAALARIRWVGGPEAISEADIAIEAVPEDLEIKRAVFRALDAALPPGAILATNTSSISITKLAAGTSRPDRFIGMHFMNPVPVMALVEVIRGIATSDETAKAVEDLARRLGKTPLSCHDYPGFVANRVLMPMLNEAIWALHEGVADKEAIDGIVKLGLNHPMGPLALADFIGLDTCLSILRVLYEGFGDPKYRACPLLVKMVEAGRLGKKTGRGFYTYTG
jgi:3-hydroxybutyryl-CoA dehydrogenase